LTPRRIPGYEYYSRIEAPRGKTGRRAQVVSLREMRSLLRSEPGVFEANLSTATTARPQPFKMIGMSGGTAGCAIAALPLADSKAPGTPQRRPLPKVQNFILF